MRILLIGNSGREPGYEAWRASLARAGVLFDAIAAADQSSPLTILSPTGTVRYQALIVVTEGVVESLLDDDQRAALDRVRREGLRCLIAYAYPGPRYGLMPPSWAGRLDGITARLSERGLEVFPYLKGPVPIDRGTWGYLSMPDPEQDFETLLLAPDGSSLLGIHRDRSGREEMVQTFDANSGQLHGHLLRQGQLAWLTRGVHVGYQRNYLTLHVDDVLLPNHGWDIERHTTGTGTVRMTADDAVRTARWSRTRGVRLDLACNGAGSERYARETRAREDPLLAALLTERDAFGWINHTFEHRDLTEASRATIEREIDGNLAWAARHSIEFEPDALVTGEHTGLANLTAAPARSENRNLAPALAARGIRFLACDASRPYTSRDSEPDGPPVPAGTPFVTGNTFVIPRHPTGIAHDVATPAQVLDRLRHTGRAADESWSQLLSAEARAILAKVVDGDPCPHFFHQSNLVAEGVDDATARSSLLCELVDAVLGLYQSLITPSMPIVQPRLTEIGRYLLRGQAWRHASGREQVEVYRQGSAVTVVSRADRHVEVPLTGTLVGEEYGGLRSGWVSVPPGTTAFETTWAA